VQPFLDGRAAALNDTLKDAFRGRFAVLPLERGRGNHSRGVINPRLHCPLMLVPVLAQFALNGPRLALPDLVTLAMP
jgi:hypothetical protein